jgi:hypothetical protein
MPDRSPSRCRLCILVAALFAATGGVAPAGRAQQVSGSIGASLTILAPIAAQQPHVTGFDVRRDGVVRIEATLARSAAAERGETGGVTMSRLVRARISSFAAASTEDASPLASRLFSRGAERLLYVAKLTHLSRALDARDAEPVELRVEYLVVPGT